MKEAIRDAIRDAIHVAINVAISAPSKARCHQRSSEVISAHPRSSEVISAPSKARCWMRDVGESVVVSSSKSFPSSTGVERPT